jgi:hypothetical protein
MHQISAETSELNHLIERKAGVGLRNLYLESFQEDRHVHRLQASPGSGLKIARPPMTALNAKDASDASAAISVLSQAM